MNFSNFIYYFCHITASLCNTMNTITGINRCRLSLLVSFLISLYSSVFAQSTDRNYVLTRTYLDSLGRLGTVTLTRGYRLSYDDSGRLSLAVYGEGDALLENLLGVHEYVGHFVHNLRNLQHNIIYKLQMKHLSWNKTTSIYKNHILEGKEKGW